MRLLVFLLTAMLMISTHMAVNASEHTEKHTYVIVHGAAGGGWVWKTMDQLLTADGHLVYRPTLTGLGEKVHLANPDINLTTHINDIVNLILFEEIRNVVLVGHSYGGMVITGVMDRIPEHIKHVIFLDAAVPQSLKTFTEPVSYKNPKAMKLPVTYVAFIHPGQSVEERSLDLSWQRAESRHWTIRTLVSDHLAYNSHPKELAALLKMAPMDRKL